MHSQSDGIFWLVVGSQELYGNDVLEQVKNNALVMADIMSRGGILPYNVYFKSVVTNHEAALSVMEQANFDPQCMGLILWMHTFSPAKLWINGLSVLRKPIAHIHTQFHKEIPWDTINMDYMNLHQAAHGDREFGHILMRMGISRKTIAGYWESKEFQMKLAIWMIAASAFQECNRMKIIRFGDNMRNVAVTEGDKVEAEIKFGWSINTYEPSIIVDMVKEVNEKEVDLLIDEYSSIYSICQSIQKNSALMDSVKEQARYEIALSRILKEGNYDAFTTNFEALDGLNQLPGLAVQRLMFQGYGFGAEGDWKTAAIVRILKKLDINNLGTSFMEDYTYHFSDNDSLVLGAHMLEICPSIAGNRPVIEVHPLNIGGKYAPARMIFSGKSGAAICCCLINTNYGFRMISNELTAVESLKELKSLPVACVIWYPHPSLEEAAQMWLTAGGSHHTAFSYGVTGQQLYEYCRMSGIEYIGIDKQSNPEFMEYRLRCEEAYWKLKK